MLLPVVEFTGRGYDDPITCCDVDWLSHTVALGPNQTGVLTYWSRWLTHRRPYLEPGTWSGYEIHGRKRLVPAFGSVSLGDVNVDAVRAFASELSEAAGVGDLAIKTANNVLGTLAICLNDAVKDGLIVANPALLVGRLPPAHIERDYLRLEEIPRYLDCCSDLYRPLALGPISTDRKRSLLVDPRPARLRQR